MNTHHPNFARCWRCVTGAVALLVVGACADKELTTPSRLLNPTISLQITATGIELANQAAGSGARFLILAAGYDTENDEKSLLGYKYFPIGQGTITATLDINIASCLADTERPGPRDSCGLLVGAALLADTLAAAGIDTVDIFDGAYDAKIIGPFPVTPGRAPAVPTIDLSQTRFGAIRWDGDDALRIGGGNAPTTLSQGVQGLSGPIAGAVPAGSGPPTLFTITTGSRDPGNNQSSPNGPFPQLAIFENNVWRRVDGAGLAAGANQFTDVAAIATNEAYVTHRSGLFRFDGATLTRNSVITDSLYSVAVHQGAGGKFVVAGGQGLAWFGNGTTFARATFPANQRIDGICVTSPNEAFASSSTGGGLFRFDGTTWVATTIPNAAPKLDLTCTGPGQAFVTASNVGFFKWNGANWIALGGAPATFGPRRPRMAAVSPTEMYAIGDSALVDRAFYKFDGTVWSEVGRLRYTAGGGRPWADPRGGAAYYISRTDGRVERVTPTSVRVESYVPSPRDVYVTSATSAFVVGGTRFIARWDGVKWTVDAPPPGKRSLLSLNGVWSDGPARAWAVGQQSTILNWNGSAWAVVSDSANPGGPAGEYFGVWGFANTAWAVGDQGIAQCVVGGACSLTATPGGGSLYSVWGAAANDIWAVGANGRIVHLTGTTWSTVASPTNRKLLRINGSGPADIWAVGDSVLLHYDGTQWSNQPYEGEIDRMLTPSPSAPFGQPGIGLWARTKSEVYLGSESHAIGRFDGLRWSTMRNEPFRRRVVGISMAPGPAGCALAVTLGGEQQPPEQRPSLWRGIGPTGCFANPMTPPTSWP